MGGVNSNTRLKLAVKTKIALRIIWKTICDDLLYNIHPFTVENDIITNNISA